MIITAPLVAGVAFMAAGVLYAALPGQPLAGEGRTVEFGRSGPCSTCGQPAPVTVTTASGLTWTITGPGTVADLRATYCADDPCEITYTKGN